MSLYDSYIYSRLKAVIQNDYGVSGLMGNLSAESGLEPTNLQNSGNTALGMSDTEYTVSVDNGTYTKFNTDSYGYGLAQWTVESRKSALYNAKVAKGCSIGDIDLQIDFLLAELQTGYVKVFTVLQSATSVREASNSVLFDFESPKDQSESVQNYRASLGQDFYNTYSGLTPVDPPTPTGNLLEEIKKTSYNLNRLSRADRERLGGMSIGDSVKIAYTHNHRKSNLGKNFYGKRLTIRGTTFIIVSVRKDGLVVLKPSNSKIYSYVNPKYLEGV